MNRIVAAGILAAGLFAGVLVLVEVGRRVGDGMAGSKTRPWMHIIGFAAVMALGVYIILDLEFPRLESLNWKIRGKQVKFLSALRLVQGLCERGAGREETERPVIVHKTRVVAGLRRASLGLFRVEALDQALVEVRTTMDQTLP